MVLTARQIGAPDRITVLPPVAGTNFSFTNDRGELLLVQSVAFLFTTSAAAANRIVGLKVATDGNTMVATSAGLAQVASLAVPYSAFSSGASPAVSVAGVAIPWRDSGVLLRQGHVLSSVTAAIDVADTFTAIVLSALRFHPEYPGAYGPMPTDFTIEQEG